MDERVAGRELDAEIARKVFGRHTFAHSSRPIPYGKSFDGYWSWTWMSGNVRIVHELPRFSTDMNDAWQVFVWLVETTGTCVIIADMEEWNADNAVIVRYGVDDDHVRSEYWHPAPLGLCRAALAWLDEAEKRATSEEPAS